MPAVALPHANLQLGSTNTRFSGAREALGPVPAADQPQWPARNLRPRTARWCVVVSAKPQAYSKTRGNGGLVQRNRAKLRLFLDTAERHLWEQWLPTGSFYGVTTNPLLLERAGVTCSVESLTPRAREAFAMGAEEVQLQAFGGTTDAFFTSGMKLAEIDPRVVVKVPLTQDGLVAAHMLVQRGLRVTMTGIYSAHQVLLAASVGADYAAPYLGRINSQGRDGEAEIIDMKDIVESLDSDLRILVASIKSSQQVTALAIEGLTTFALSPEVVADMFYNEDTARAAEDFERAARNMQAIPPPSEGRGEEATLQAIAIDG
eukprot:TRINITY_DN15928_c0_g1_i1.p1 TRINITY_DN15928_c0_g1~~TRINITY_DN15928_c0_g1_i1.p1  ORF type:complete len:318 (+),score=56.49 TRINITY_DN15928_c0_g1_i1:305-1258(+)